MFTTEAKTKAVISQNAWDKQRALIEICDAEVGWFGTVETKQFGPEEFVYYIEDIYVPEQTVSRGSVLQNGDELMQWAMTQDPELVAKLNYYGHSHVNGGVFTSGVDLGQIIDWGKFGIPFMINFIANKQDKWQCRLDQFVPRFVTAEIDLVVEPTEASMEWAFDEIADKVEIVEYKFDRRTHKLIGEDVLKPKNSRKDLRPYVMLDKGHPTF